MKNKKNVIPPAPIVCRLSNGLDKFENHIVIFTLINILIGKQDIIIADYFEHLNYFTGEQYILFCNRITDKRNRELQLNQLHLIIFYAMLHLTIQLYQSERIKIFLKSIANVETVQSYEDKKINLDLFCNAALNELRKDYKNNNTLIIAMNKIDAYSISCQ